MFQCKHESKASRCSDLSAQANLLYHHLSPHLQCAFDAASERRASYWLKALPISEHGFTLPKGESVMPLFEVWLAASEPASSLCMWKIIFYAACF